MQSQPLNSKPKWLRKLERESWQAELIISGLAILGSLQLPELLDAAERYTLLNYDRDTLFVCYMVFIYWRLFVNGVIVLFIFHFIVRALWIGLVGLNSVYPGGFSPNERYPRHFQDNLKAEYGDIDGFITRLDRLGSGVFGIGFGISGVFLNFGLTGVVLIVLHSWLVGLGVAPGVIMIGLSCLVAPVLLASITSGILHSKWFKDGAIARRYLWPITKNFSKFIYPLAGRYITTSINLTSSYYLDRKGIIWYFLGGLVAIMIIGLLTITSNPNIGFFIDKVYHRMGEDSTRMVDYYPGDGESEGIYYRPVFDRPDDTSVRGLSFWVPIPEREEHLLLTTCSLAMVPDSVIRTVGRKLERIRLMDCAREYLDIALNDSPVTDYSIKTQYLKNEAGQQFGIHVYVPDPTLRKGQNLLEITTAYPHPETGEPRRTYTPFYHRMKE